MQQKSGMLRRDLALIALLLFVSALLLALHFLLREEGDRVRVEQSGVLVAEYDLRKDGEYLLNGGTNRLVIQGGAAYMAEADCPDETCVHVGKIRYGNQRFVCLPNRITVTVVAKDGADFTV